MKRKAPEPPTFKSHLKQIPRERWEKICWDSGTEWVLEQPFWKRIWEPKKKPIRDKDGQLQYPATIVPVHSNSGFALLSTLKKKVKKDSWYDIEIYAICISKLESDNVTKIKRRTVVSELVELLRQDYQGQKLIYKTSKRSFIEQLIAGGFAIQKTGGKEKILFVNFPRILKKKKNPPSVHCTDIVYF